jgi:hypothetical protein
MALTWIFYSGYTRFMKDKKNKLPMKWVYLIFGVLVVGMLVWTSMQALRETPTRKVTLELPGQGWVTLSLTTNPYPPLPTGTVAVSLRADNSRGVMVDLGEVLPYSFGAKGSQEAFDVGQATRKGSTYQAGVGFPTPGDYWLIFELEDGYKAEFQIYVEPAQ